MTVTILFCAGASVALHQRLLIKGSENKRQSTVHGQGQARHEVMVKDTLCIWHDIHNAINTLLCHDLVNEIFWTIIHSQPKQTKNDPSGSSVWELLRHCGLPFLKQQKLRVFIASKQISKDAEFELSFFNCTCSFRSKSWRKFYYSPRKKKDLTCITTVSHCSVKKKKKTSGLPCSDLAMGKL